MLQPDSFYTLGTLPAEAPTIEGRRAQPGRCQASGHSCLFSCASSSSFFLLSVSFPFCLYFLLCLLVWLALFDLACMACIA